mgnify:FL=1
MNKFNRHSVLIALLFLVGCQADSCSSSTQEPTISPTLQPAAAERPEIKAPEIVDTDPLTLTLISPSSLLLVVEESSLEIEGKTRMDALLTVGHEVVEPGLDGKFSHTIALQPGHNLIEILASSSTGEQKSLILAVIYSD